jgi:hypothetical protein
MNTGMDPAIFLNRAPDVIVHGSEQTAPAAGTVLVDSGQLTSTGIWMFLASAATTDTAANLLQMAHRNAANNADLELSDSEEGVLSGGPSSGTNSALAWFNIQNVNERVVVRNKNAGTAALFYQADIYGWIVR